MENFNKLLRKTYVFNRKAVLLTVGAVLLACVILGALMGLLGRGAGSGQMVCFGLLFLLTGTMVASMSFADFKTKMGKISTLMTPATAFQKFLVRWLAVVPLLALLMIIGFYVGDLSRIIANNFSDYYRMSEAYRSVINVVDVIASFFPNHVVLTIATLLIYYFFWQSLYMLGGILWPKLSFIKTFAVIRVANLVLLPFVNKLDEFFPNFQNFDGLFVWVDIVGAILTIGIYWLIYHLMKRSTIA